ncbi:hypothetical protein FACS1894162_6720 [Bacteroidia bacterium]|nr:hypothetical protein FACS1894162_6720 [Bacteroidia bacterium]
MKKIIVCISLSLLMFSCDVAQQLLGAYQFTQCKYDYNSIAGLSIAGVNLSNIGSNPLGLVALTNAFTSKSGTLPLDFTLNLDVTNPNTQEALMNGLGYILEIDGHQMTAGSVNRQIKINSGQKVVLPIQMTFDLKQVLQGESLDSMKNLALNFAGIGNNSSKVTVKLRPSFSVGNQIVTSPADIPVSFTVNKK